MLQVKSTDDFESSGGGGMVEQLFQSIPATEILIQTVQPQILPMEIPTTLPPPLETNIGGVAGNGAATFAKNTKKLKKSLPYLIGGAILALIITIYSFTKKKRNGKRKY